MARCAHRLPACAYLCCEAVLLRTTAAQRNERGIFAYAW
jgi:hypothetical protein